MNRQEEPEPVAQSGNASFIYFPYSWLLKAKNTAQDYPCATELSEGEKELVTVLCDAVVEQKGSSDKNKNATTKAFLQLTAPADEVDNTIAVISLLFSSFKSVRSLMLRVNA